MSRQDRLKASRFVGQFIAPCTLIPCILILIWSFVAWSQPAQVAKPKNTEKSEQEAKIAKGGRVIEFKQLKLEGVVQRPSAAYLMQRRRLKFKGLVPKKSFISKIKKSVMKAPF